MPNPLEDFQAANVAPPVAPQPPADVEQDDPALNPFAPKTEIPKGEPPDRPIEPPPEDLAAQVSQWWQRTELTAEARRIRRQIDRDTAALYGMPTGSDLGNLDESLLKDDAADLTNQHIFRNAVQSMALIMPEDPEVLIEPESEFPAYDPATGQPVPTAVDTEWRPTAMADLLSRLWKKMARESKIIQNVRTGVQDAHHYEMVVFKTTWQSDYRTDALQDDRLPDVQSMIADTEAMLEAYERGDFTDTDAEYRTLTDMLESIEAQTELPIWRGPIVKSVPLSMFRYDGKVRRFEDLHQAEWMRQDFLMTRAEVLRRFKTINPDDLRGAQVYSANGMRQANDARTDNAITSARPDVINATPGLVARAYNEWDLLLVVEIYDRLAQKRRILVEGLTYYARIDTPTRMTGNFFPFRFLMLNRPPGNVRVAGFSDTELQAKEQSRLNRIDSDEDEAMRAALPRGIYDKDSFDDDAISKMGSLNAHEYTGVKFNNKDLSKSVLPIPGANIDGSMFGQRRATCQSNLRAMSGIPEQLTGAQGDPKFAETVKANMTGASTLNKFRRTLVVELLHDIVSDVLEHAVMNLSSDEVAEMAGENARLIWDAEPKDRESVYRKLKVQVKPSMEGSPDKQETLNGLQLLAQTALANQEPIPMRKLGPLIARVLNLSIDAQGLFEDPDPNTTAMVLAKSVTQNPDALQPPVLQQLMQILMPLAQKDIAMMAQQRAAEASGQGPGPNGPPPGPGGPPPGPNGPPPGPMIGGGNTMPMPAAGSAPGGGQPAAGGQPNMMPGAGAAPTKGHP